MIAHAIICSRWSAMALMPLPEHHATDAATLQRRVDELIVATPPARALVYDIAQSHPVTAVPYLLLIHRGQLELPDDGVTPAQRADPGSALLFLPGSAAPLRDRDCEYLRITWDTTHTFIAIRHQAPSGRTLIDGCTIPGAPDPLVDALVERARQWRGRGDDGAGLLRTSWLAALISEARLALAHDHDGSDRRHSRWDDARRYIARHIDNCTRARVARACGITEGHVGRLVRRHTGHSFVGYLRELRLEQAEELLAVGQLDVQEIAQRCGFRNVSHFIRLFKTRTGTTPAAWREREAADTP